MQKCGNSVKAGLPLALCVSGQVFVVPGLMRVANLPIGFAAEMRQQVTAI